MVFFGFFCLWELGCAVSLMQAPTEIELSPPPKSLFSHLDFFRSEEENQIRCSLGRDCRDVRLLLHCPSYETTDMCNYFKTNLVHIIQLRLLCYFEYRTIKLMCYVFWGELFIYTSLASGLRHFQFLFSWLMKKFLNWSWSGTKL